MDKWIMNPNVHMVILKVKASIERLFKPYSFLEEKIK